MAENKPVEPEQGNSCEGKVALLLIQSAFFGVFPVPIFNRLKQKR